ncbi:sigma-70 family RNA polymerase sigma factor [Aquimarina sp. AD10]|uniref:RNA polymerase sigma factor n=1 Tax=Aquimarina sp. AD10 TaxID=1714849 RepID=UPI000E494EC4|nr:sigma-70 family RNA polymerase sigma factor [Aquimarina sp. AD10]AXT59646.1 sigma-70 family RNA polymerase sigma factor [Aquimarina sp. AD10]RKM97522.1 sigma-70 family RNA polymerase sigma factor [Aquimarina sp. AD10]
MKHKNFGLSEASFEKLITDLKRNDTQFFEQVFLKQFKETMKYLSREYKASHEDAYDATMDALIEFRARFVASKLKYGNLRFLFTKMASQMFLRNLNKVNTSIEDHMYKIEEIDESPTESEELNHLKNAWKSLGDACKQLLTWHFYGKMKLIEIASETNKSPSTIRKQKERCIQKLKDQFAITKTMKS